MRKILANEIYPHPVSWFLWGVVTFVAYYVQRSQNGGSGAWATGLTAAACFLISGLSLKNFSKNDEHISALDLCVLALGLSAAWLYWSEENPQWAAMSATAADLIGYGPTILKGWKRPHDDDPISFFLNGIKFLVALGALESYSVSTALYPLAIGTTNIGVSFLLVRLRKVS